ncbi:hypothetical protein [Psittacid alphaherpesvirus 5]|uniref:Uncharacterized protein n=1 Tax=Psittacid alphaherpesvirus 5 TaxID=2972693 RepID=A0A5P9JR22_9ALPH|nr:hypothetical protein QKU09_gp35 [Psittacid alphaherpesvirus 5]QFU14579.1 hypothetical protein [Psittacid alphaherpesvirus 5]UOO01050.1 hypothetical protein [Psittacid alphaherpesvirus 5]
MTFRRVAIGQGTAPTMTNVGNTAISHTSKKDVSPRRKIACTVQYSTFIVQIKLEEDTIMDT